MNDLELQLATREQELRAVYRERAHLVAHLASEYQSSLDYSDPDTPDWAVVIVQLPTGQLSWHIAPDDVDLFAPLALHDKAMVWDGHSTEEKYARLDALTAANWDGTGVPNPNLLLAAAQEPVTAPQPPQEAAPAPKRRGRPRKTAQTAPAASETPKEA